MKIFSKLMLICSAIVLALYMIFSLKSMPAVADSNTVNTEQLSLTYVDGSDTNSDNYTGYGPDKLIDGEISNKWCTNHELPLFIEFSTSTNTVVKSLELYAGNDTATFSQRNWNDWSLYGKNSSGAWVLIQAWTGETPTTTYGQCSTYPVTNEIMYKEYRLEITSTGGTTNGARAQMGEMKLYGYNLYDITYNSNGGSEVQATVGTTIPELTTETTPTKEGYGFAGWYTDSALTKLAEEGTKLTSNVTLYAKWVKTVTINNVSYTVTDWTESSVAAVITGDATSKAYDSLQTAIDNADGKTVVVLKDLTDVAVTTASGSTVTLDLNGYTLTGANSSSTNVITNGGTLTINDSSALQTGLVQTNSGLVTAQNVYAIASYANTVLVINGGTFKASNIGPYFARYGNVCTLYFGGVTATINGGTFEFASSGNLSNINYTSTIYLYGGNLIINGGTISRTHNDVETSNSDSSTGYYSIYKNDGTISITGATYGKTNFTAYDITYNTNGGSEVKNASSTSLPTTLPETTKVGYTFEGWYTDSTFTTKAVAGTELTENVTLYASWTVNKYNITYNLDGGTNGDNPETYTYGVGVESFANPTKTGYTFAGWYDAVDGGNKVENISATDTEAITLYAKWIKYITYNNIEYIVTDWTENSVAMIIIDDNTAQAYDSLQTALNAADGTTVVIIKDISNVAVTVASGTTVTLDLNGYTLTGVSTTSATRVIINRGTLTINDSSANQTGVIQTAELAANSSVARTINTFGLLTINGGTIINRGKYSSSAVSNKAYWDVNVLTLESGGSAVINGGTLKFETSGSDAGYEFTCAIFLSGSGFLEVNGGTITRIHNNDSTIYYSVYRNGGIAIINGGTVGKTNYTTYAITYNTNGGSVVDNINSTNIPNELPEPTKVGHTFEGWYTDSTLTTAAVAGTALTEDITLYAYWTANTYNITYNLDGGTNGDNPTTYTYGVGTSLNDPTKTGYTFVGWYDAETDGNKVSSISKTDLEDKTLYAYWTVNTYNITYNLDGGTNGDNPTTYTYGVGTGLKDPTKTGYTFVGWYDAETNGNKVLSISKTDLEDITLYAYWTVNTYNITYVLNDGTNGDNPTTYTYGVGASLNDPTKTGYTFVGWYDAASDGNKVLSISKTDLEDITLYAYWTANTYNITYNLDGGTNGANPTTFTYEEAITLVNPTKMCYRFEGWYLGDALIEDQDILKITSDITLDAKWTLVHGITHVESDLKNHWHVCNDCGSIIDGTTQAHYDSDADGFCDYEGCECRMASQATEETYDDTKSDIDDIISGNIEDNENIQEVINDSGISSESIEKIDSEVVEAISEIANDLIDSYYEAFQEGTMTEEEFVEVIEKVKSATVSAIILQAQMIEAEEKQEEMNIDESVSEVLQAQTDAFLNKQYALLMSILNNRGLLNRGVKNKNSSNTSIKDVDNEILESIGKFTNEVIGDMNEMAGRVRTCSSEAVKKEVNSFITVVSARTFMDFDVAQANAAFVEAAKEAIILHIQEQSIVNLTNAYEATKESGKYSASQLEEITQTYEEELGKLQDSETFYAILMAIFKNQYLGILNERYESGLLTASEYNNLYDTYQDDETFEVKFNEIFEAWALQTETDSMITLEQLTTNVITTEVNKVSTFTINSKLTKTESIVVLGSIALIAVLAISAFFMFVPMKKWRVSNAR